MHCYALVTILTYFEDITRALGARITLTSSTAFTVTSCPIKGLTGQLMQAWWIFNGVDALRRSESCVDLSAVALCNCLGKVYMQGHLCLPQYSSNFRDHFDHESFHYNLICNLFTLTSIVNKTQKAEIFHLAFGLLLEMERPV